MIPVMLPRILLMLSMLVAQPALAQICGDGAIDASEGCDDGNLLDGDGCAADCLVENGWFCVPSMHASGVNPAGAPLAPGSTDPHWVWSLSPDGTNPTPGHVARNPAWANLPPGNWITTDPSFGGGLTTQPDTFWFQDVFMPANFAGNLSFAVAVSADNQAEVFVNGVSFGGVTGFGAAATVSIPSSAFTPGNNTISIRLIEYIPSTPRGILMYPGGGGILSQCALGCSQDGDCDDGNACTQGACLDGACNIVPLPFGTVCTSTAVMGGVCGAAAPDPMCLGCVNTATVSTSTVPDLGCDAALPFCDDASAMPFCVECELDSHCGPGGSCDRGDCIAAPIDAGVPDLGPNDLGVEDLGLMDGGEVDLGATDLGLEDGSPSDLGPVDAGTDLGEPDAGETVDVGAQPRDAGADPRDAGSVDLGMEETEEGCDCSAGPTSAETKGGVWALLGLLLCLRTRRR